MKRTILTFITIFTGPAASADLVALLVAFVVAEAVVTGTTQAITGDTIVVSRADGAEGNFYGGPSEVRLRPFLADGKELG